MACYCEGISSVYMKETGVFWVGSCVKVLLVNKVCVSLHVGVCNV